MAVLNVKKVPEGLYKALKRRAQQEHRSMAQEVVYVLSQYLQAPPRRSIVGLRGLGKEIWKGVDPKTYIERLRDEWNH